MKKRYILAAIAALMLSSCYKDQSTVATFVYPDIEITQLFEGDALTIAYGDDVVLGAEAVQKDTPDGDLEYLWEVDITPGNNKERAFLSNEKSFEMRVVNRPSTEPYYISLTVTNKNTGFSRSKVWPMYVINSLGEGILVAHTADDGKTSDVSLLTADPVSYGYTYGKPRVVNNLFSLGNDAPVEGRINAMISRTVTNSSLFPVKSFNENRIIIGGDTHVYALDPISYKVTHTDHQNFGLPAEDLNTKLLAHVGGYQSVGVFGKKIYTSCDMLGEGYDAIAYPSSLASDFNPCNTCLAADSGGWLYHFDSNTHLFYTSPGWSLHQNALATLDDSCSPQRPFLADKYSLGCGILKGGKAGYILTDNAGGYWCTVLDGYNNAEPLVMEMTSPAIATATQIEFCDNADVFFFTDGSKIFTNIISGANLTTKELSWKPDSADEEVTMLRQYRQAWYGTSQYDPSPNSAHPYRFILQYHRLQMVIVTHNRVTGEGKIYIRPFNVSTGMFLAFQNSGTYGGFDRITAICTTMR